MTEMSGAFFGGAGGGNAVRAAEAVRHTLVMQRGVAESTMAWTRAQLELVRAGEKVRLVRTEQQLEAELGYWAEKISVIDWLIVSLDEAVGGGGERNA